MDVQHALTWADNNSAPETLERLRSRRVAAVLASEVRLLRTLLKDAFDELNGCREEGDFIDRTHYCGRCDSSIDRNGTLREKIPAAVYNA